ncbi:MAG: DUF4037 domain-containing protein [Caldilineaceae bacterium]
MREQVSALLPPSYEGHSLRGACGGRRAGARKSLQHFLVRTIGIDHAPQSYVEWLQIPEEDVIHVINGEVWHDPTGEFFRVRTVLNGYYPEPVRLRRIAHWCRYFPAWARMHSSKPSCARTTTPTSPLRHSSGRAVGVLAREAVFPVRQVDVRLPRRSGWPRPMQPLVDEAVNNTPWNVSSNCSTPSPTCSMTSWCVTVSLRPHPRHTVAHVGLPCPGARLRRDHPQSARRPQTRGAHLDQIHFESFHSEFVWIAST